MNTRSTNLKAERGGQYATSGTITGMFEVIFAHEAANIDYVSSTMSGTLTSVAIPAGAYYFVGNCTSITINSGKITAYKQDRAT